MKDKRVKKMILQWGIPLAVFAIIMGILLIRFSVISKNKELEEVKQSLVQIADSYANEFENKIEKMAIAAKPLAAFMENYTYEEIEIATNVAACVAQDDDIYMVVMSNVDGEGMTDTGDRVSLQNTDYFEAAMGTEQKFLYSENDGIFGKSCIISVVPMQKNHEVRGFLFAFYDTSRFESVFKKKEFDQLSFCAVLNEQGESICQAGAEQTLFDTDNFWNDLIRDASLSKLDEIKRARTRFVNGLSGTMSVSDKDTDKDYVLAFASTKINGWMLAIGVEDSYVKQLQAQEWKNTGIMMQSILIGTLVLAVMLIVINVLARTREVESRKKLEDKAELDLLTGLNNKVSTETKITQHLQKYPSEQGMLFVLDIDNFKKINDTMGHAFGDEVLRTIGKQISSEFRVTDILGRTGGDEFMIYLKNIKDDAIARKEARKIEEFFKNFRAGEYVKYSATASIGVAMFPQDAQDFEALYKAADKALYQAKRRGKNQLAFYKDCQE